jgi:hypothetical protein
MSEKKDPSKSPRETNGPVVKTGPTAGQNRSRNDDGAWRKKRDDAGKPPEKRGCFITTAVCGYKGLSDDCHELRVLRAFRDCYLNRTPRGREMVHAYYAVAPGIVGQLQDASEFERIWHTVRRCVEAIEIGEFKQATALYLAMVLSLSTAASGQLG